MSTSGWEARWDRLAGRAVAAAVVLAPFGGSHYYLEFLDAPDSPKIRELAAAGFGPVVLFAKTERGFEADVSGSFMTWPPAARGKLLGLAAAEFQTGLSAARLAGTVH